MTDPILDPATWASLRALDDGGGFIDELIDLFIDDAGPRLERLRSAMLAGDRTAAQAAAHSLRGGAGNIGAAALAALARDLEHALDAGRPMDPAIVDTLAGALRQVVDALTQQRSRPRP